MSEQSLQKIQYWMKTVLISRGDLQEKLRFASQKYGQNIEQLIEAKKGVSAHKRLDIYASGYVLRLVDCLKSDFPDLCEFMGNELFDIFAKAYIVTLPSKSWSLYNLGKKFSKFLSETSPTPQDGIEKSAFFELPEQIAYLERAKAEVLISEGNEKKNFNNSLLPDFLFAYSDHTQTIKTLPCLKLLKLNYPVHTFLKEFKKDNNTPLPEKATTFIAVTRLDYHLHILELEAWQYEFLIACSQECSIYHAAQESAQRSELNTSSILAQLLIWLPVAQQNGCLIICKAN
jgi:hypothetical protein